MLACAGMIFSQLLESRHANESQLPGTVCDIELIGRTANIKCTKTDNGDIRGMGDGT